MNQEIYKKDYGFLSFAKSIGKSLSNKYGQKLLDSDNKSTTDVIKTKLKRAIQKTAETTGDLIGNKIADVVAKLYDGKITKVLKNLQQNNSETVINEYDKQIPKERYISLEKRQKVIDDLTLR